MSTAPPLIIAVEAVEKLSYMSPFPVTPGRLPASILIYIVATRS